MFAVMMALALAAGDAGENGARGMFMGCVKGSMDKASAAKVAPEGFAAFVRQACASEMGGFRANLIAYDIRAGWTRKKAEPDADGQIGDAIADWTDRYRDKGSIAASK
ncbi:MAG: hypothetical protein ABIR77_05255 [Sphingomicrobium sp.]